MNDIEWLKDQIEKQFPDAKIDYSPTGKDDKKPGNAWLEITQSGKEVTVEWRPDQGFGLYRGDEGYGEGPAEVIEGKELALQKIMERLRA